VKYIYEESDIHEGIKFKINSTFTIINVGVYSTHISDDNVFLLWNLDSNESHGVMSEGDLVKWLNSACAIPA